MQRRAFLAPALVLMLALAGCVTPAPDSDTAGAGNGATAAADWPAKIIVPQSDTHDHRDWSVHQNMSTPNFQVLAYDPLATEFYNGQSAVGYFCGGSAETADGRKLTVISSLDSDVAFVLVDVTDPTKPTKVGEYVSAGSTHYDVDISADGRWVVLGNDLNTNPNIPIPGGLGLGASRPMWRDACGVERPLGLSGALALAAGATGAGPEEMLPLQPATLLIDVSDPANPTFADALPAPAFGPHSVSTATIDGTTYVASSITNLAQPADYFQFSQIQELPTGGGKLVLLSTVDGSQYGAGGTGGGHVDAEIALHPVTNQMVAYLSNWDGGMVILDLSQPAAPMLLGAWADEGPSNGALHSTRSLDVLWGDKHYVIAGQEFIARPEDRGSGWIYVIDDTDPANPTEVGRWTLPLDTEPNWAGPGEDEVCCLETWSTHYFRVVDKTLFVAMYHAGLWAVDLTDPAAPKSIGAFVPDRAPPEPRRDPTGFYDLTPFVLDVFPQPDYTLTVFDGYSGVYSLKFDVAAPAPAVAEWPMTGKAHEDG